MEFGTVVIPEMPALIWTDLCRALANISKTIAPTARIEPLWHIPFTKASIAEKVKALEGIDINKIHCWVHGLGSAAQKKSADGESFEYMGGNIGGSDTNQSLDWMIKVNCWGIGGYEAKLGADARNAWDQLAIEADMIGTSAARTFMWGIPSPADAEIAQIYPMEYGEIDLYKYEDGSQVILFPASVNVRIRRM